MDKLIVKIALMFVVHFFCTLTLVAGYYVGEPQFLARLEYIDGLAIGSKVFSILFCQAYVYLIYSVPKLEKLIYKVIYWVLDVVNLSLIIFCLFLA